MGRGGSRGGGVPPLKKTGGPVGGKFSMGATFPVPCRAATDLQKSRFAGAGAEIRYNPKCIM